MFLCFVSTTEMILRLYLEFALFFAQFSQHVSFSRTGIMFQDITTLLLDHKAFKHTIDIFVDRYKDMQISVVAGKTPLFFFLILFFPCLQCFVIKFVK